MDSASIDLSDAGAGTLRVRVGGRWRLRDGVPDAAELERRLAGGGVRQLRLEAAGLSAWDSSLVNFAHRLHRRCAEARIEVDDSGLPQGVRGLLALASAVPPHREADSHAAEPSFLAEVGDETIEFFSSSKDIMRFIGEATIALARVLTGRGRFRGSDLFLIIQQVGAQALPIVSLISFLVGVILAFVGAVQLEQFGVQLYIANLVGLGMARDMGAMMTGIIMAGRTGAAFAAELGTMTVNEEIDALKTLGLSPMEFLVIPRIIALVLMMPMLVLYSDLMGILGGAAVGVSLFDISVIEYVQQTRRAIDVQDIAAGLFKGLVYGAIVAVSGCLRGMQCGRSAAAVGTATTSAVVTGIVFIVVACAVLTVIYNVLGI
ncbi:MAG: ABC transporter permease [Gammaproteobacteria bacterium]|nr:ABC transporter permease [Gammaproteobacteria bacterium]